MSILVVHRAAHAAQHVYRPEVARTVRDLFGGGSH